MLGLLLLCLAPAAVAQTVPQEYSVKAALLYNFARFAEWPDDAFAQNTDPMTLVVFGDEDLAPAFVQLKGRKVHNRPLRVVCLDEAGAIDQCHILFLTRNQRDKWPQVRAALDGQSVLLVGEMNGFLPGGGIINMVKEGKKIRFEVNTANMRNHKMKISSRILKLATKIIDEGDASE